MLQNICLKCFLNVLLSYLQHYKFLSKKDKHFIYYYTICILHIIIN